MFEACGWDNKYGIFGCNGYLVVRWYKHSTSDNIEITFTIKPGMSWSFIDTQ